MSTSAKTTCLAMVFGFLFFSVVGSPAKASMDLEIGPGLDQLPLTQWTSEMKVDKPNVLVRVESGVCPRSPDVVACSGDLNQGGYDITINLARLPELGIGFYRSTWFHELGHAVDHAYFGSQVRTRISQAFGYPADRGWIEDVNSDPANGVIGPSPSEWFAVAYSACAWGPDIPDDYTTYGFTFTYSQVTNICQIVDDHISGNTFQILTLPPPAAPCPKRCGVALKPWDRFVSKAQFAAGSIRIAFPGKKPVRIGRGCRRMVRIGIRKVRVNTCGQYLIAKLFGQKKLRVQYWGSPLPPPVSLPPLPVRPGGQTTIAVQTPDKGNLPLQEWVNQAAVPVPETEIRASYGSCVPGYKIVCASSPYGASFDFMWVDLSPLGEPGFELANYRAWLYRELGGLFVDAFLGPQLKSEISAMLGYPPGRGWTIRDASAEIVDSPEEFFAEAYATCAWGSDRPASSVRPLSPHTYASVEPVCRLIKRLA